jgi:hypothetical protein
MTPSNDWRGIHPYEVVFRKWVVAWKLSEFSDGSMRSRRHCWTRSGAERLVNRLNFEVSRRNQYAIEAMSKPSNLWYELVGNLNDHPNRRPNE